VRTFFQIAAFVDFVLVLAFFNDPLRLLNSQIAFIASLFVVLGSYFGYARMVKKGSPLLQERDAIEKIEDPYDLYTENEPSDKSAKEIFEEERLKVKRSGNLKAFVTTYKGFFSPFRLFGYLFLIISVLVLIRKGVFDPWSYLIGLGVVPVAALIFAVWPSEKR
jgi:hypothetical protein